MGFPKGTYLNGIRDEKSLMDRCNIDPVSGCWRWRMCCSDGAPSVHLILPGGDRKVLRGRRAALILKLGRDIPASVCAYAAPECRWHDCVAPEHALGGTRLQSQQAAAARGAFHSPAHRSALQRLQQASRKVTPEQQREIVDSDAPVAEVAAQFSLSLSRVKAIRRGVEKPRRMAASAFEWRPA